MAQAWGRMYWSSTRIRVRSIRQHTARTRKRLAWSETADDEVQDHWLESHEKQNTDQQINKWYVDMEMNTNPIRMWEPQETKMIRLLQMIIQIVQHLIQWSRELKFVKSKGWFTLNSDADQNCKRTQSTQTREEYVRLLFPGTCHQIPGSSYDLYFFHISRYHIESDAWSVCCCTNDATNCQIRNRSQYREG